MKGLQLTCFILFAAVLSTQTLRHLHLHVFSDEPASRFAGPMEQQLSDFADDARREASTRALEAEYEASKAEIQQLQKAEPGVEIVKLRRQHRELFDRNEALAQELSERMQRQRQVRDVWLFSIAGYGLIGLGTLCYWRNYHWEGMSLLLPGFLELTWWSAPAFSLGGAMQEYELLLVNKIILSLVALTLLYLLWLLQRRGAAS